MLIVGRGGGSVEDLWAFNSETVARAIAESPVPVISAVGHETDVTIADLVADLRAPTPSAAAEAAVPDGAGLRRELHALGERLRVGVGERVEEARASLSDVRTRLAGAGERAVARRRDRVASAAGKLQVLSPLAALSRGFAIPASPERRLLRSVSDFAPGARFSLTVADGRVPCRVETAAEEG